MTDKKTWKFRVRPIRIDGDIAYVPLPDGKEAIIDADMADAGGLASPLMGSGVSLVFSPLRKKPPRLTIMQQELLSVNLHH